MHGNKVNLTAYFDMGECLITCCCLNPNPNYSTKRISKKTDAMKLTLQAIY